VIVAYFFGATLYMQCNVEQMSTLIMLLARLVIAYDVYIHRCLMVTDRSWLWWTHPPTLSTDLRDLPSPLIDALS